MPVPSVPLLNAVLTWDAALLDGSEARVSLTMDQRGLTLEDVWQTVCQCTCCGQSAMQP